MSLILVVDDDEFIRDTLYDLLSEHYRCQTAETAEKALARLEVEPCDVVLTDISMPGLSGLATALNYRNLSRRFLCSTQTLNPTWNNSRIACGRYRSWFWRELHRRSGVPPIQTLQAATFIGAP